MKTRISKIMMIAAALIFVGSGVSLAHDWNDRKHKRPAKTYGHYKVQKHYPGWKYKHFKRSPRYSQRHAYKNVRGHRYYKDHHRRQAPRRNVIYRTVRKDPTVVFKIVLKNRR